MARLWIDIAAYFRIHHRGHRGAQGKQVAGGEEGFAEVAGDDFFFGADGGEIDAGIPALKCIDVRRYTMQVVRRQALAILRSEKWIEELGDAGGVHLQMGL